MCLAVFRFVIVMMYMPMFGVRFAFYDYKPVGEYVFVGFKHFEQLVSKPAFWNAEKNTLVLSTVKLLLNTFMAVIVSILLNEMMNLTAKKFLQTVIYLPHFMS